MKERRVRIGISPRRVPWSAAAVRIVGEVQQTFDCLTKPGNVTPFVLPMTLDEGALRDAFEMADGI